MKIGLFIPCYIDQFYPQVGIATLELLEKLGCRVEYPAGQTCCGQPMANTGCEQDATTTYQHFVQLFHAFDYVVAPSGSCVYHVRKHYDIIEQTEEVKRVRKNTLDLAEFLLDVLQVKRLEARFPHKVGLHQSCHGLRGLRLGSGSERILEPSSKLNTLLRMVAGIELVELTRADECCGFGGTFAINEPAISVKMGKDRIADHERQGVEVLTAGDMSCLMHLEGIIRRQRKTIQVKHIAEILNGASL
ncbi:MAG: (Fe-S)-binding protein [Lewinellaceae bacterium]|nr:(Fe-S)-binding protein [Phaeodactylibacter sp.]MCB0616006.1 (Fe-S)-binding protein [Phaeodactylibacter sp.]MCB9350838.1 (Fe-S)-binding protein [Lewinellaceae bacterium]